MSTGVTSRFTFRDRVHTLPRKTRRRLSTSSMSTSSPVAADLASWDPPPRRRATSFEVFEDFGGSALESFESFVSFLNNPVMHFYLNLRAAPRPLLAMGYPPTAPTGSWPSQHCPPQVPSPQAFATTLRASAWAGTCPPSDQT